MDFDILVLVYFNKKIKKTTEHLKVKVKVVLFLTYNLIFNL